jgi:enamine deaminase RidA (YjgF/YER057c/UK114 family)
MEAQRNYLLPAGSQVSLEPARSVDAPSTQGLLEVQDISYSRSQTPDPQDSEKGIESEDDDRVSILSQDPELSLNVSQFTFRRGIVLLAMAFLFTSSQMPLYFVRSHQTAQVLNHLMESCSTAGYKSTSSRLSAVMPTTSGSG